MNYTKLILLLNFLLLATHLFSQNLIPKFVEPEFSAIMDTSKYKLPDSFKNQMLAQPDLLIIEPTPSNKFPEDWAAFKKAFLALQLPVEYQYFYDNLSFMNQWHRENIASNYSTKTRWNPLNPIQSLYDAFSKEAKEQRKYNALLRQDHLEKTIGEKCPAEIVKMITGNTSDSTVAAFFRFCCFTQEQIDQATPYDVCTLVSEKWQLFVGKQEEDSTVYSH